LRRFWHRSSSSSSRAGTVFRDSRCMSCVTS
jgi:hypothetical protein